MDRDGNVLGDPRELFGHAIPAREHGVFSDFEYASHDFRPTGPDCPAASAHGSNTRSNS
jgi:hypothetical protein